MIGKHTVQVFGFVPIAVVLGSLLFGCTNPPSTGDRTVRQSSETDKACTEPRPASYTAEVESRLKAAIPLEGLTGAQAEAALKGFLSQEAGGTRHGEDLRHNLFYICQMANNGGWDQATTVHLVELVISDSKSDAKAELERQTRKPYLEIAFNGLTQKALRDRFPLPLVLQPTRTATLRFVVVNVGKGSVLNPMISAEVDPQTVRVDGPRGSVYETKPNHHRYQTKGTTLHPIELSGSGYEFTVEVYVPADIETFNLLFRVHGDNLPHKDLELTFRPIHYTKPS